jgi:hypothetical protein
VTPYTGGDLWTVDAGSDGDALDEVPPVESLARTCPAVDPGATEVLTDLVWWLRGEADQMASARRSRHHSPGPSNGSPLWPYSTGTERSQTLLVRTTRPMVPYADSERFAGELV